jgi:hypothetical protein
MGDVGRRRGPGKQQTCMESAVVSARCSSCRVVGRSRAAHRSPAVRASLDSSEARISGSLVTSVSGVVAMFISRLRRRWSRFAMGKDLEDIRMRVSLLGCTGQWAVTCGGCVQCPKRANLCRCTACASSSLPRFYRC